MALILELRQAITPLVKVGRRSEFEVSEESSNHTNKDGSERPADLVEANIVLSTSFAHRAFSELRSNEVWRSSLATLLPDFVVKLSEAMDLMSAIGTANEYEDLTHSYHPSIASHAQNRQFEEWTVLIDLVRDAWLALAEKDAHSASLELRRWSGIRYPLFRRLAFFGAVERPEIIDDGESLNWLLVDQSYWLWTIFTRRETIRLVVSLSIHGSQEVCQRLQEEIVKGPPTSMYRNDLDQADLQRAKKRLTWLLLAKIRYAGAELFPNSSALLNQIEQDEPNWRVADDESDEFTLWLTFGEDHRTFSRAPTEPQELMSWLQENPDIDDLHRPDDWSSICEQQFDLALSALSGLQDQNVRPIGRWHQAFNVWSQNDELLVQSWRDVSPQLERFPDGDLRTLSRPIAWWLKKLTKTAAVEDPNFLRCINHVLDVNIDRELAEVADNYGDAINDPAGLAIEAALASWFRNGLEDDQGLDSPFRETFDKCFDERAGGLRPCRIIMAAYLVTFFRVDPRWTVAHLVPEFDWTGAPENAAEAWTSFLHSPRIFWPLLTVMKEFFLAVPENFDALDNVYQNQFCAFLTYAALDPSAEFSTQEFRDLIHDLPDDALAEVAETLFRSMESAGEQKQEYFENRVKPFINTLWPNKHAAKTPSVARSFALLCAVSGNAFPCALELFGDWLQPAQDLNLVVHHLNESKLASKFPQEVLMLLSKVADGEDRWILEELKVLLVQIRESMPELEDSGSFRDLIVLLQQRGFEWP